MAESGAIDWRSSAVSEGTIAVEMVSPNNPDQVYGQLDGIIRSGSSISAAYDGDNRTSGSLKFVGDGWVLGSFLRISYTSKAAGGKCTIGTYVATANPATRENGQWITTLTLQSAGLYTLSKDNNPFAWTVNAGASIRRAMHDILDSVHRPYVDIAESNPITSSTIVLERGNTTQSWLYSLADMSNLRLDCDQNGRTLIQDYVAPRKQTASMTLDITDPRGVVIGSGIKRTTDYLSYPGQSAVVFRYTTSENDSSGKTKSVEHFIIGVATANGNAAPDVRGYTVTDYHSVSELNPQTPRRAQELATQYLAENSVETVEWNLSTSYLPLWEGDVVDLIIPDGVNGYSGKRHCLVKSVDIDLETMQLDLVLKETG